MKEDTHLKFEPEYQSDFLTFMPGWPARWGILAICVIIIMGVVFSAIIEYPETLNGSIIITTNEPTIRIVNKVDGRIEKIAVKNEAFVKKGTMLAEIESTTSLVQVEALKKLLQGIHFQDQVAIVDYNTWIDTLAVGQAQDDYSSLSAEVKKLYEINGNTYYPKKLGFVDYQMANYQSLIEITSATISLSEKDLENSTIKFNVNKELFDEKVIPLLDYQDKQGEFIGKQQQFNNIKKQLIENKITLNNLAIQRLELVNELKDRKLLISQNIYRLVTNLSNYISTWSKNYVFSAPNDGTVKFFQKVTESQFVRAGETLLAIVPPEEHYQGIITLPSFGFGKLKLGQDVFVTLDNFPVSDFGKIRGKISNIYSIPDQKGYTVYVSLDDKLTSSYNKKIPFFPEMTGKAEVIIDKTNLLGRILKKYKEIFKNY